MIEDTNPSAEALGSDNAPTPTDLSNYDLDMEDESVEQAPSPTPDEPETQVNSEPDDFALAEGGEETEGQTEDAEQAEPVLASEDMVLDIDGEKIPLSELKKSRLLEADYTRSKQAVSQERSQLQEVGKHLNGAFERVVNYLASKLPPEPDPQLAFSNPQAHYQQQVMHQAALAEMQQVLDAKGEVDQAGQFIDEQGFKALMSDSDAEIVKQMPHLKDPNRLNAFNRTVLQAATSLGYTEADVRQGSTDPRMRMLVYKAAGYDKMKADAAKGKAKVQEAKPMLPVQRIKSAMSDQSSQIAAAQQRFDKNPTPQNLAALMSLEG